MKLNENQGKEVTPGSLYEAQMAHRLGFTPQWIVDAKNNATGIEAIRDNGSERSNNHKTYNLNGQQVDKAYKGVVVRNGKKTFQEF